MANVEVKKIDHIGIAVSNLEQAKQVYERLLGSPVTREEALGDMKIAFISVGGVNLELIESTSTAGVIAGFIEKRGEGVHHIAYEVDDVSGVLEEMKTLGFKVVGGA